MRSKPVYVEIEIDTEMDRLWEATQTPDQHEKWDLRFSSITYLPKLENEPQKFLYKTKIGFGISIEGWGKTAGTYDGKEGARTSSLHFGTSSPISPIQEGKGYWQYKPNKHTITFLTQYDYSVNFGRIGQVFDCLLFRPMIGWGTALSFDVLKRWLEKGEPPSSQYIRFFNSWLIYFLFFFIWVYHGLVPKLLVTHPVEMNMVTSLLSLSAGEAYWMVIGIGIGEIIYGLTWLLYRHKRRLFILQFILFPALTLSSIVASPSILVHPFTPLTLNSSLLVISIVGYLISKDLPTATSCKRRR